MSRATYRAIRARERVRAAAHAVPPEPSYRDLQAAAKEAEIPANQSADDLKAALEEAGVGVPAAVIAEED